MSGITACPFSLWILQPPKTPQNPSLPTLEKSSVDHAIIGSNRSEELKCVPGRCQCATAIRGQVTLSYGRKYNRGGMVLRSQDCSFRYFQ
jgi:hypothetical protein